MQVHTRHLSSSCSMSCFLDEVSTLSCVRHENIQLFMGACCDHSGQSLALIMRYIIIILCYLAVCAYLINVVPANLELDGLLV